MQDDIRYITLPAGPTLAYVEWGQGPTSLLFVHGLGSSQQVWQALVAELSPYYRCIALDLPGYGQSSKENYQISLDFFAETLAQFVVAMGMDAYIPVGHSMGGQIVIHALLGGWLHPSRAILFAPAGVEVFSAWEKKTIRSLNQPSLLRAQSKEQVKHSFHYNFYKTPTEALPMLDERLALMDQPTAYAYYIQLTVASINAMLDTPVYERLKELNLPVLVIYGEDDKLIPNRFLHPHETTTGIGRQALEALPHARLIMLAEAGHVVQWEQAKESALAVKDFVGIAAVTDDEATENILLHLYDAFVQANPEALLSHYHPEAVYDSPLTGPLTGDALKKWYHLICGQPVGHNRAELSTLEADDFRASLQWRLHYPYRGTQVALSGQANFDFQEGKIIRHHDDFNVWTWASLTDGWRGWSLGWNSTYQARLRANIRKMLGATS